MDKKDTIVIVDDHPLFREGLKTIIEKDPSFKVLGEASNSAQGIALVKELEPDVVIVDISMPGQSGIQLVSDIAREVPQARVLISSMHTEIKYVAEAVQNGAFGYVVKGSPSLKVLEGIRAVAKGDYYIDSALSIGLIELLQKGLLEKTVVSDAAYLTLTPREQEIMRLLAEGLTPKEIAEKLFISVKTVDNHRVNTMNKLGVRTTIQIVRYAARLGLIDIDLWKE